MRMVRLGEGTEDTGRRVTISDTDAVLNSTIQKLANERLIVIERDAGTGAVTAEVAHDALIRRWQLLRYWIDSEREFLRIRERIIVAAQWWSEDGRPPDRLSQPGRPLAEGEDLAANRAFDLDPMLIEYIELSAAAANARQAAQSRFGKLFSILGAPEARDDVDRLKNSIIATQNEIRAYERQRMVLEEQLIKKQQYIKELVKREETGQPLIFISYAKEDVQAIRQICAYLKDYFRTWLDEENIPPGRKWKRAIEEAIDEFDFLLLCRSKLAVTKKGFIHQEQTWALEAAERIPDDDILLIPARLEACDVPSRLQKYQYIDLFVEGSKERLTRSIAEEWVKRSHIRMRI